MKGGGGQTGTQLQSIRNVSVRGQTRRLFSAKAVLIILALMAIALNLMGQICFSQLDEALTGKTN